MSEQIKRQLDLFEQHAGSAPDHIDGHQHVQQFPVIRDALIDTLVMRYPGAKRPWLRVSRIASQPWELKAQVINAMGADSMLSLAQQHGFACSQYLTGVYNFLGDTDNYRQRLRNWLTHLPQGTVLMCHPAADTDHDAPFAQARQQEQDVLLDPELPTLLNELSVRIIRGKMLFASRPA